MRRMRRSTCWRRFRSRPWLFRRLPRQLPSGSTLRDDFDNDPPKAYVKDDQEGLPDMALTMARITVLANPKRFLDYSSALLPWTGGMDGHFRLRHDRRSVARQPCLPSPPGGCRRKVGCPLRCGVHGACPLHRIYVGPPDVGHVL